MPNQRQIAAVLGISQATVSLALRSSPSVSSATRKSVLTTAKRMGYQPNMYVNDLTSHVRSGKKLKDRSVFGLLIEAGSQKEWYIVESYRIFHQGLLARSEELGFHIESFFFNGPKMNDSKIDRILHARGINGIILAPPYHGNRSLNLHWERYAAIGVGFGWDEQDLNRVVYNQLHNFITAFNKLRQLGYERIGTVLGDTFIYGNRHGIKWLTGYLECQNNIPPQSRIPVLSCHNPASFQGFSEKVDRILEENFREWFRKWSPDVILTTAGREKKWLDSMRLRVPQDVGLACLALHEGSSYAGINEKGDIVGATTLELVAAQVARQEFGLPVHSKTMMIDGVWVNGTTIRKRS